ncbi:MAG: acyl carrier protein [Clostridiales Family XIII bacterium]|jgi:acyl carrier protein|nr:acyl carrier protein [Clostridiales Family XIII bacterium]
MDNIEDKSTKQDAVFNKLKLMVTEIIGEDVARLIDITENSKFVSDLGMDSIVMVSFAEKVNKVYGEEVDLMTWISKKNVRQLLKLSMGDLAEFIAGSID